MPRLDIDIQAKYATVMDGLDKIRKEAGRTAREVSAAFDTIKSIGVGVFAGLAGAFSFTAVASQVNQTVNLLSQLKSEADKVGESVEKFSGLYYDLGSASTPISDITQLLSELQKKMAEVGDANSRSSRTFQALGIDVRDSSGNLRGVIDVAREFAAKMSEYEDGTNKVILAQGALGESGSRYLPILKDIADVTEQSAGVTKEQAEAADQFKRSMSELGSQLEQAKVRWFSPMIEGLRDVSTMFNEAQKSGLTFLQSLDLLQDRFTNKVRNFFGAQSLSRADFLKRDLDDINRLIDDFKKNGPGLFESEKTLEGYQQKAAAIKQELDGVLAADKKLQDRISALNAPQRELAQAPFVAPTADRPKSARQPRAQAERETAGQRMIEQLDRQLQAQQELTRFEEVQLDIARQLAKDKKSISDVEQQRLLTMAKQFDATKEAQRAAEVEQQMQAIIDQSLARSNMQMEERAQYYRDLADPVEKYIEQLREIANLEGEGQLDPSTADRARDKVNEQIEALRKVKTETEKTKTAANDFGMTFQSALEDVIVKFGSLTDAARAFAEDLRRMFARQLIIRPLMNLVNEAINNMGTSSSSSAGASSNSTGTTLRAMEAANNIDYGPAWSTGSTINVTLNGSGVTMQDVKSAVRAGMNETVSMSVEQSRRG